MPHKIPITAVIHVWRHPTHLLSSVFVLVLLVLLLLTNKRGSRRSRKDSAQEQSAHKFGIPQHRLRWTRHDLIRAFGIEKLGCSCTFADSGSDMS